jgi:hypothetical protein
LGVQQSYYDQQTRQRKYGSVVEMNQKMQVLLQEINPTKPPTDLPDLEQAFFQGLHENIKLKVIDNLNAGPPANLGQNLRRYNDIVRHATAAEEEQKRVAKTIQQITRSSQPSGRPNTRSQPRAGGPRVFMATPFETVPERHGDTLESENRQTTGSKGNTWTHTPTGTKYNLPMAFCSTYTGNSIAEDMVAASVEMVDLLEDEEKPDGFAGVSIVEQALRNKKANKVLWVPRTGEIRSQRIPSMEGLSSQGGSRRVAEFPNKPVTIPRREVTKAR